MQHLKICLPTDLPTTEAYFSFQLIFLKYRVLVLPPENETPLPSSFFSCFSKLNCSFGFSSRKVSQRDSSMAAFMLVHVSSYGGPQKKIF